MFLFKIIRCPKFTDTELKKEVDKEIIQVSVNSDIYVDSTQSTGHGIPIRVSILQTDTGNLREIDLTAFPDEFRVIRINKHHHKVSEDQSNCAVDSREKRLIIKDLENRGVTPNTIQLWKASFKNKEVKQVVLREEEAQKRLHEEERRNSGKILFAEENKELNQLVLGEEEETKKRLLDKERRKRWFAEERNKLLLVEQNNERLLNDIRLSKSQNRKVNKTVIVMAHVYAAVGYLLWPGF